MIFKSVLIEIRNESSRIFVFHFHILYYRKHSKELIQNIRIEYPSNFQLWFQLNNGGYCKIARVNLNDIKEHRKRNYVELIDTLGDLDRNHANVSAIFDQIENVEKSSNDILHSAPDNGNACVIKVKYSLNESIRRLKELCDLCIAENLDIVNKSILNVKKLIAQPKIYSHLINIYRNHSRKIKRNVWMKLFPVFESKSIL